MARVSTMPDGLAERPFTLADVQEAKRRAKRTLAGLVKLEAGLKAVLSGDYTEPEPKRRVARKRRPRRAPAAAVEGES